MALTPLAINDFTYNFIKIHRHVAHVAAMAAGVVGRLFDVADLVSLLIDAESQKAA